MQGGDVIVFVGHGTRKQRGLTEFHEFCDDVKRTLYERCQMQELTFDEAFLEIAEPNLADVLSRYTNGLSETLNDATGGAVLRRILLVPLFLFDAGHMKEDIPVLIKSVQLPRNRAVPLQRHATVEILPAVGRRPAFAKTALLRLKEGGFHANDGGVLLLGRGNRDEAAQADFAAVASVVKERGGIRSLYTGYLAGTGTSWTDVLTEMAESGLKRIYIQPYLWFHGWLTEQLPRWVGDWKRTNPTGSSVDVRLLEPLGVHPALVESIASAVYSAVVGRRQTT